MKYEAEQFKNDVIINIQNDASYSDEVVEALENSRFEFEDSSIFTRREWNTYIRKLKIYCSAHGKAVLESQKKRLYQFMDSLHGVREDYMLMELIIFASAEMEDHVITSNRIIMNKHVEIDKANDLIGTGGFASIYKVDDNEIGVSFAYKIFDPSPFQGSSKEIMKKRFLREAKKVLSYSHENIVHAYDFGFLGNDSGYIKLEYIDGKKVIDYIKDNFMSEEDKNRLASQYVSAMAYIHGKADIHRDISYSNVMVDGDGNIKVLDFGFARGMEDSEYDTIYQDIVHKFMPPDERYDIRTEIYCIGAILFSIYAEEEFHISKIDDISSSNFKVYSIINKCLEKNPDNRYQSAIELKNDFEAMLERHQNISMPVASNKTSNGFSLDYFEEMVNKIASIEFQIGMLPSLNTVKEWVEVQLPDFIEKHYFRSKMNFTQLIKQFPGLYQIHVYRNESYEIEKSPIEELYKAYIRFPEKEKSYMVKGIYSIILGNSIETQELPFN